MQQPSFPFFRLFAKMQERLLTEDIWPTFVSDLSGFHHGSGSMEGGQCTRKGKEVATLGRKFESFVVGKLRKSLGVWEGGWRGQKGTGL